MSSASTVRTELAQFGPDAPDVRRMSLKEAEAYTRGLARSHYENFPVATCLLPRRLHQHFYNVYAFCRWADDLGDELDDPAESERLLQWWREELAACYRGESRHPVFVALAPTIHRFAIPAEPFEQLISAFEQDQRVREYETWEQLRDYCRRSADPVGRIVLRLFEWGPPEAIEWSDSICTGLQLANMWQDVARDLDIGRVYLPREDRQRFGYGEAELRARVTNPAFLELMGFEVERARGLLLQGLPLADAAPRRLALDIELFARGGLAILDEIERIGCRVWDQRPVLTKARFLRLMIGSLWRRTLRMGR
jgi:squalene synthase HpnC